MVIDGVLRVLLMVLVTIKGGQEFESFTVII
jgi:hypothetical protein